MPIQFHCPHCNHLLQTPDGTEGKKARCPSCNEVLDVPRSEQPSTDDGFGFADTPGPDQRNPDQRNPDPTSPTAPFADAPFADAPNKEASPFQDTPAQGLNPYASPGSLADSQKHYAASGETGRDGPPWERDGRSLASAWQTIKSVFSAPTETFRTMRRSGGLGSPLLFAIFTGFFGGLVTLMLQVGFQATTLRMQGQQPGMEEFPVGIVLAGIAVFGIILIPVGIAMNAFVWSGILHLMLLMYRGANFGFETTFRVVCYTMGTCSVLQLVPCLGPYAYFIAWIVYLILGLIPAQEISGGKSSLAVLTPILVCCGGYILMIIAVFGFLFSSMGN